jgi:hypothetical protein
MTTTNERSQPARPAPTATDEWKPKDPKALHPDIVKKEANLALHALRPQPRGADIETILNMMFHDRTVEFTDPEAIHKAAVARYKETFKAEAEAAEHEAKHPATAPAQKTHDK